ncbi:MAG: DUF4926 domain-containing protein [Cyanosarcina radialis HA8281-LM2]|jgi:hypothetical protein|nr:DUF4926 domain-containing protein [Cyanosarcina radialis HA8281-LM2]
MIQKLDSLFKELDTVALTRDLPEQGLKRGDIGAIVHCYSDRTAFEVEFVDSAGDTIALLTLTNNDIQLVNTARNYESTNVK